MFDTGPRERRNGQQWHRNHRVRNKGNGCLSREGDKLQRLGDGMQEPFTAIAWAITRKMEQLELA